MVDTNETIEVSTDDGFFGTHKGVNIPFSYNRQVIAAIGITGEPEKVRQYALFAQKITSLILREQEIDLMDHNQKNWQNYVIRSLPKLAENYQQLLSVGVGNRSGIFKQSESYHNARLAIKSLGTEDNFAVYDELELEILLGCVTDTAKKKYLEKTTEKLGDEELNLLRIYFEQDMSLKDTAEKLFLHKNTLQYQLNRIEKITGYNPRSFQDAVKLYC